jgi:hypothetical protein
MEEAFQDIHVHGCVQELGIHGRHVDDVCAVLAHVMKRGLDPGDTRVCSTVEVHIPVLCYNG